MHMFSTLINNLCHENKLDDACKYFQTMLDMGIRPPTPMFSNLKQALLEEGKEDIVITLNKRLEKLTRTQIIG
jgi:pentatricopeptide repeat protein